MKQTGILGCAVLAALMLAGTGAAGDQIDTSNILVMGYYTNGTEIDLSQAIQEFDYVTESTGQYVEGKLTMWCDCYYGTNPGNIQDYERRDGVDTDILFATNVTVRVKSDGWIVAWLTNDQNISDIVFWNDANKANSANYNPSDTTIGKAIWRITDRVGIDYNKSEVSYYSYKYPAADRLLVGGRMVTDNQGEMYHFLIPSATTLHAANHTWTAYLHDTYSYGVGVTGSVKVNDDYVFSKGTGGSYTGLYEFTRYSRAITDMTRDTRHTIYLKATENGHGTVVLKSAVAILYQS